jgi:CheY-like chemotaxis protein
VTDISECGGMSIFHSAGPTHYSALTSQGFELFNAIPEASRSMKALRILVAEDDALIGMLLEEMLTGMGHYVCSVEATETDTVTGATKHRPDMMIIDALLGDGSGIEAVDKILLTGFIPHVFASGDALGVRMRRPTAVVIGKPYNEQDLTQAMLRALDAGAAP